MRKILTIIIGVLITCCGNSEKEQAEQLLLEAQTHFEQGDIETARANVDSLRKTFPNIVQARRGALKLYQEIELKAAQNELVRTDSLLKIANQKLIS